jgi:hypothetical protein
MLMLALAGACVTFLGSAAIWLMDPERRLQRALKRVLNAWPDAQLLSPPSGRGAGLSVDNGKIAVCWDAGAWCLIYRVDELLGAELLIDDVVVARALKGEPSRVLDRSGGASQSVVLRLIFDDARHPDFDLALWTRSDQMRRVAASPAEAIAEANSWLARTEAILKRPKPAAVAAAAVAAPPPPAKREPDPDEDADDDEAELPF